VDYRLGFYFKNDRNLFADILKIIFSIVNDYYSGAAKIDLNSAAVVSHQTYVDILRHNPHWHCIILEGGIDENNSFHYLPINDTLKLTEVFRRWVIKLFV